MNVLPYFVNDLQNCVTNAFDDYCTFVHLKQTENENNRRNKN